MKGVLFASDLHLNAALESRLDLFLALLKKAQTEASQVYLLGDLVEFWLGDDDPAPIQRRLIAAFRALTDAGVELYVALGNRDFLIGDQFRAETGAKLLADYTRIDLFGTPTLLTHGDLLCTKDIQYQEFRRTVREPARQRQFLDLPLAQRRQIAESTRSGTQASMLEKDSFIMDVDDGEVTRVMDQHEVRQLIHGHTHRAHIHRFTRGAQSHCRIVLGEWYTGTEVLWCTTGSQALVCAADLLATLGAS